MNRWQAIVFDLDDTLYPERDYVRSGFWAVACWTEVNLGISRHQSFAELLQLFAAGVRGDTFNRCLENHRFEPDKWVPHMVQVYRDHRPDITPYPRVPELLRRLRQIYRLGLVSDGYLEIQKRKLDSLRLAPHFDALVFSDEWGRDAWKPSSQPFEIVLARLGVTGPKAVYVADNPFKDFLGARHIGMRTVRVRYSEGLYSHLEPSSAEHAPDADIATLDCLEWTLINALSSVENTCQ